jgi:hypothetical protein
MEAQGEKMCSSCSFTTSALDGVSGQRHTLAALYPRGKKNGTHWAGGWVAPEPIWTRRLQEITSCLCRQSNLVRPVLRSLVRHYTYLATPAQIKCSVYKCIKPIHFADGEGHPDQGASLSCSRKNLYRHDDVL